MQNKVFGWLRGMYFDCIRESITPAGEISLIETKFKCNLVLIYILISTSSVHLQYYQRYRNCKEGRRIFNKKDNNLCTQVENLREFSAHQILFIVHEYTCSSFSIYKYNFKTRDWKFLQNLVTSLKKTFHLESDQFVSLGYYHRDVHIFFFIYIVFQECLYGHKNVQRVNVGTQ